ncbi:hypothetical protein E8E13_010678 [Curvularia kusanoi]|uniref:3'-5' exonuclease domain-containing protein n=1 Tax=Curvularia kusanoi TaxID=90978 RepID=A0A9P4TJF0_CURKU|nr:hypothetical protein E8E13_010678 [Curvularia kusanoi]
MEQSGVARETDEHQQTVYSVRADERRLQTTYGIEGRGQSEKSAAASSESSSPTENPDSPRKDYDAAPTHWENAGSGFHPQLDETFELSKDDLMTDGSDRGYLPDSSNESESQAVEDSSQSDDASDEAIETHTPLDFQIPDDVLQAALGAPENSRASFWSSNLYRGPEDQKILVHYCKTKEVAERVAQHFIGEKVIGFDIEWKPYAHPLSIKKNVSLIQLACEDRIALFHIAVFTGNTVAQLVPPTLKTILESPDIYKVGVAIKGDLSRVSKHLGIEAQGVFELSRLNNLVQHYATDPSKVTKKLVSLTDQVQQHLQLPLYKGGQLIDDPEDDYNVRSSDWSLPLNHEQIHYAAADAYAGFRLYDAMEEKRKRLKPTPPRPLVCDHDPKTKPRTSDAKPRKKRTNAAKTEEALVAVTGESNTAAEQEAGEDRSEDLQDDSRSSQDTDAYETAREDNLDSHQLEGEEPVSEGRYESTDESSDDDSLGLVDSPTQVDSALIKNVGQRRVGRINLSWLKGPDPGYPVLPKLHGTGDSYTSSDEDLVDISEKHEETVLRQPKQPVQNLEEDEETDEFDDSELEEALQDLSIDSDGELHQDPLQTTPSESAASVSQSELSEESSNDDSIDYASSEQDPQDSDPALPPTQPEPNPDNKEEQHSVSLPNDSSTTEYLRNPTSSLSTQPAQQTPEYTQATTWAQTYLASTIPSPSSRTPSHIRATIPHLRAYNMWHYQKLPLDTIARLLRDPPLSETTVAGYVLQAITLEKMEYDRAEVRELLMGMSEVLRRGKWRVLAEKVGAR